MNDLIITTNSYTPAKVDFNYQQIADQLEVVLDKYKGLVFTEETASDCKKTITDLRKGKKSVEDFRKETKAKLSESIVEFENDCKKLSVKFDSVIIPLTQQADFFEVNRKEEKRIKVQEIINKIIIEYELDEKYREGLLILDTYLGSSISIKKVTENLTEIAIRLKDRQDQEESNKSLITSIVDKANKENEVSLLPDTYTRLLEYMNTNDVVTRIYKDVEQVIERREIEKQRVIDEAEKLEQQKLFEKQKLDEVINKLDEHFLIASKPLADEHFGIKVTDVEDTEAFIYEQKLQQFEETRDYRITATKEELEQLEKFLNGNFREWENISLGF